jgi:hypothetical protein
MYGGDMDPITTAILAALGAGVVSGLTETGKTAVADAYGRLKDVLAKKFGASSEVMKAVNQLESKPTSGGRKETLIEEVAAVQAEQDREIVAQALHVLTLVQPQQVGQGKYTIQNNALVQGQNIADYQQVTQHFGNPPKP